MTKGVPPPATVTEGDGNLVRRKPNDASEASQ